MKIAILGAGIMGKLIAFFLIKQQYHVTLFDKEKGFNNCSHVAAGLLSPVTELIQSDSLIFRLGSDALRNYWPFILNSLSQPIYFKQLGSLLLAHPRDQHLLSDAIQQIAKHYADPIKSCDISIIEPELSRFRHGYFFAEEGQIDSQSILSSLQEWLGERIRKQHVDHFPGASYDWIIDCRGLGAKSHFPDLRSVRGECIWIEAKNINLKRPVRLLHPHYPLYLVPRPNNIFILGASEIETEDKSPISVKTTLELLSAAFYLHPGFAEARIINTFTQNRPTLIDHRPTIKWKNNIIAVNGLYRHGFLIGPTLAQDVARFITDGFHRLHYPECWEKVA